LLHNESTTPHHWLRLDLQGTKSNRDAVGARVAVSAGGRKLVRHRKGGGRYCSASDPRLFFGLGEAARGRPGGGRWASGLWERFGPLAGDRAYRVVEGEVEVRAVPSLPATRESPGEVP